jgi:hypothetical protein
MFVGKMVIFSESSITQKRIRMLRKNKTLIYVYIISLMDFLAKIFMIIE